MSEPVIPCACARPGDGTHAVAVDPEIKHAVLTRLRRIEGQLRGLQKMVEEERYCADVLIQVSSVQEALRGVSRSLLQNHLKHCAAEAIRSNDPEPVRGDVRGAAGAGVSECEVTGLSVYLSTPCRCISRPTVLIAPSTVRPPTITTAGSSSTARSSPNRSLRLPTSGSAIASPARWMNSR